MGAENGAGATIDRQSECTAVAGRGTTIRNKLGGYDSAISDRFACGARERVCRSAGGREEFLEACRYEQKAYEEAHEENRWRKDGASDGQSCSGDIVTVGWAGSGLTFLKERLRAPLR